MSDVNSSTNRYATAFAAPSGIAGEDAHAAENYKSARNSTNLSQPTPL
jgi:hypothetical protein